jgi:hypothetical protein
MRSLGIRAAEIGIPTSLFLWPPSEGRYVGPSQICLGAVIEEPSPMLSVRITPGGRAAGLVAIQSEWYGAAERLASA